MIEAEDRSLLSSSQVNKEFTSSDGSSGSLLTGTIISDNDFGNICKKLDQILHTLSQFKIDLEDIKERVGDQPTARKQPEENPLPMELPLKNLSQLETLEAFITKEGKTSFIKHLKKIGGNDFKDFSVRILRTLISNSLAELCSWTGRKNNFEIGCMNFTKIMFETVHLQTKCTSKDFENVVREWLRHAKQRKLREEKNKGVVLKD